MRYHEKIGALVDARSFAARWGAPTVRVNPDVDGHSKVEQSASLVDRKMLRCRGPAIRA
jgi:hypothetical protein